MIVTGTSLKIIWTSDRHLNSNKTQSPVLLDRIRRICICIALISPPPIYINFVCVFDKILYGFIFDLSFPSMLQFKWTFCINDITRSNNMHFSIIHKYIVYFGLEWKPTNKLKSYLIQYMSYCFRKLYRFWVIRIRFSVLLVWD